MLFQVSGHQVDVLRAQHFVDNPVEDIEDQEGEGEDCSGNGVNALGPIAVAPAEALPFPQQHASWGGAVDAGALPSPILRLQAVAQPVASQVEAALANELFLLAKGKAVSWGTLWVPILQGEQALVAACPIHHPPPRVIRSGKCPAQG